MSNTKKIASIAFTGAAAAAATLMGGGPAFAAVSWHVRNGTTGFTGTVKANLKPGTSAQIVDKKTGKTLKCTKAVASGTVTKSNSPAPSPMLGHLTAMKWNSCSVDRNRFAVVRTTAPDLIPKQYNPVNNSMSAGKLSGPISAKISGLNPFACTGIISGTSAPIKYKNVHHSFIVNLGHAVTLKVKSAHHCLGLINSGDSAYFTVTYIVSTPANLIISRG